MKRAATLLVLLAIACAETPARTFQVGEHRIEVVVPVGWQALDHGRQLIFRSGETEVILTDLGAVRPEGFRAEAARAEELWRSGRKEEARTRLGQSRLPADGDFPALYATIDAMKPEPLEAIVEDALPLLGHDEARREVKSRQETRVDGREAMAIETWMTLTHADRRCLLVVVNAGRALAIRCDRCEGAAADAFADVTVSLHFVESSRK